MDRINGANFVDIGGGRRGFRDVNTITGVAGTEVTALFLNMLQEELSTVILDAGIALDPADWGQLLKGVARSVQSGKWTYAVATGSANNLAVTLAPATTAIPAGATIRVKISAINTGAATLNVNGLGAVPITNASGGDLAPGDLIPGIFQFIYSGTSWVLVGLANSQLQKASVGTQQTFLANGTFTFPAGVTQALVRVQGGGGGGAGGGGTNNFVGGGGAAGGYSEKYVTGLPGSTVAVTIGPGGGIGTGNLGGTGGTTSFGSAVSATGGTGGNGNPSGGAAIGCAGGTGGIGVGGDLNVQGGDGGDGNNSYTNVQGGHGGGSFFGGGGRTGAGSGQIGRAFGSGGGGCWGGVAGTGGIGAPGLCIVQY